MERKYIGVRLRTLNNTIKRHFCNTSCKKEIDKISGSNGWIIAYLSEKSDRDVYQKDIEDEFCITKSTVSKVIDLMVQKGLVERKPVEHDARLKKLILTKKSMDLTKKISEKGKKLEELITKGFSDEELVMLSTYLERMQRNIEESDEVISRRKK